MLKKVLFFSCEPGGAEVLIPVIDLVKKETNYQVIVLAYGLGAERFARKSIEYIEIEKVLQGDSAILQTYLPDLLITSATSLPAHDMSEKYLWQMARQLGISSLAFLDQWQNYSVRFSGTKKSERLSYLPDYINCIDKIGKIEMICEGFSSENLVMLGHPYLSDIQNRISMMNDKDIKSRLSISEGHRVFLFVSEPILEHYGSSRGYDQYQVLELFLNIVSSLSGTIIPIIKLHPKDQRDRFEEILNYYEGSCAPIVLGGEFNPQECLLIADYVFGMTSIMLVEAYVMGKKVVSLQPDLCVEDPLVLTRHHLIPLISSLKDNVFDLADTFKCNQNASLEYHFDPSNFMNFLNEI